MLKISDEIEFVAKKNKLKISKIDPIFHDTIINEITNKYTLSSTKYKYLWENFKDANTLIDHDAWQYIKEFINENECIIFFNVEDDKTAFLINDGKTLYKLLFESYGFEFYITDSTTNYLICFNHHDILYGLGEAYDWIETIKNRELS